MAIERLGPIDPIAQYNKAGKAVRQEKKDVSDSISVSDEGKMKAEFFQAVETVRLAPDVRADRIAELKKRINEPGYINQKVIDIVADRLLDVLKP